MNFPLRTAFTVSHRFWVVVFSFSFVIYNLFLLSSLFHTTLSHTFISLIMVFFSSLNVFIMDTLKSVKSDTWFFPGGSVAETLWSQCKGACVWSLIRELDPTCYS